MSLSKKDPLEIGEYLEEHGISQAICAVFEDNEIDGEAFLELTLAELNSLVPNKLGVVKKIYKIVQAESAKTCPMPLTPISGSVQSFSTECASGEHESNSRPSTPSVSIEEPGISERSAQNSSFHSITPLSPSASLDIAKFVLPTQWRPSVMQIIQKKDDNEKRRILTPEIRNAIVRDLVSSMHAYRSQPNKEFCTVVAKRLVGQYPFMKDAGSAISGFGSWEKKLIERAHNVAKSGKRPSSEPSASTPKRGRPTAASPILQRYPPLPCADEVQDSDQEEQALKKELEKEKPRKDVVVQLLRATFQSRRRYILTKSASETVLELTSTFKALAQPYVMEWEMDLILKRRDTVKGASEDWKLKWTPAILSYCQSLKGKVGSHCRGVMEEMYPYDCECNEKRALMLIVLLLMKGDARENLKQLYIEHEMDEDLDAIASVAATPTPLMVYLEKPGGIGAYALIVEKKVICLGLPTLCTSLSLWFSLHYIFNLEYKKEMSEVAVFLQEFVFGLPAPRAKKSATYLTACSSIQGFTEM